MVPPPSGNPTNTQRVLLVYCSVTRYSMVDNPLGITVLAGVLKHRFGNSVILEMMQVLNGDIEPFKKKINDFSPTIVGLSLGFGSFPLLSPIIAEIRVYEEISLTLPLLVLGNLMANQNVDMILQQYPDVIICMGMGEDTICEIVRMKCGDVSLTEVPNITYLDSLGHTLFTFHKRVDLTTTGRPLLDFIPEVVRTGGVVYLEASRGCGYNCAICSRKTYLSHNWHGRQINDIVDELVEVSKLGVLNVIWVDEDFFGRSNENIYRIIEKIKQAKLDGLIHPELKLHTSASVRSIYSESRSNDENDLRWEMFRHFQDVGLTSLFIGIESGSESQLKRYGKSATLEENREVLRRVKELKFYIVPGFITLDPMISIAEIKENIQFLRSTGLDKWLKISIKNFIPMKQCRFTDNLKKRGLIKENSFNPHILAYDFFFQDSDVAAVVKEIKNWEENQITFLYQLKLISQSRELNSMPKEEQQRFMAIFDKQS